MSVPGEPVCGRTPGAHVSEYEGGAPTGEGADQGLGHAWTSPVHGSWGGRQTGAAGGADCGGGAGAGGAGAGAGGAARGGRYVWFSPCNWGSDAIQVAGEP